MDGLTQKAYGVPRSESAVSIQKNMTEHSQLPAALYTAS